MQPLPQAPQSLAEHLAAQDAILTTVTTLLCAEPAVYGLVLGGSHANNAQSAFSDIDLECYLRQDDAELRRRMFEQVGELAPALCRLWIYDRDALYLLANGVRLDLTLHKPERTVNKGRILFDPDGVMSATMDTTMPDDPAMPAEHPPHWDNSGDPLFVDWFFWMFRQVYCWAYQADSGYRATRRLLSAQESLHAIRTSLRGMRFWTIGQRGEIDILDPAVANALRASFVPADPRAVRDAIRLLLGLYERIAPEYCQKAGIPYPEDKTEQMYALLDAFDQAAR